MTAKALTYLLRLREPVLVAQGQAGEENSAVSFDYVPGSSLRGALAGRYLQQHPTPDLAGDEVARRLFFDGTVRYLNAYPYRGNVRLLPRPLSWMVEKDEAGTLNKLYDLAFGEDDLDQAKQPTQGDFCSIALPSGEQLGTDDQRVGDEEARPISALLDSPQREMNIHIGLREVNVRTDENDVYRYEALATGEVLAGVIVGPEGELARLHHLMASDPALHLGTARTAGYGYVELDEVELTLWQEYAPAPTPNDCVVVTLLSDAILRNPEGQVDGDLDGALARLMGVSELRAQRRFARVQPVGGFNSKWGLPLPQSWALAAGSVAVYDAADLDADALRAKVAQGIGERRTEGFGRVAVNWHTWPQLTMRRPTSGSPTRPRLKQPESIELAQRMAARRLVLLLERGLAAEVDGVRFSGTLPPNSQLSQVRLAAQQARHAASLDALVAHVEALKKTQRQRQQFERAKVNATASLLDWLQGWLTERRIEHLLPGTERLPQIAGRRSEIDDSLRALFTARVIDGVMRKAIRQNQEAQA